MWTKEEDRLSARKTELIKELDKLNAKFSRLDEKEKNAGCLQPHLQRKRDRYLKKG